MIQVGFFFFFVWYLHISYLARKSGIAVGLNALGADLEELDLAVNS